MHFFSCSKMSDRVVGGILYTRNFSFWFFFLFVFLFPLWILKGQKMLCKKVVVCLWRHKRAASLSAPLCYCQNHRSYQGGLDKGAKGSQLLVLKKLLLCFGMVFWRPRVPDTQGLHHFFSTKRLWSAASSKVFLFLNNSQRFCDFQPRRTFSRMLWWRVSI